MFDGMIENKISSTTQQEKVELVAPPEGSSVGERLFLEGVVGGPFEPVSAAQMDKKKILDKILPVRIANTAYSASPSLPLFVGAGNCLRDQVCEALAGSC